MRRSIFSVLTLLLAPLLVPATAFAQDISIAESDYYFTTPGFFAALVGGLILAIAFQFVLTNLSVAVGASAFSIDPHPANGPKQGGEIKSGEHKIGSAIKKITTGAGVWAMVTATIALFFASWLAVDLGIRKDLLSGAVFGLAIWGLFYIVMITFEWAAMSSLVGGLIGAAKGGMRTAFHATSSVFSKSPEDRVEEAARRATEAVRDELTSHGDIRSFRKELEKLVDRANEPAFTPADVRKEVETLLEELQLRSVAARDGLRDFEIDEMIADIRVEGKMSADNARRVGKGIKDAFSRAKGEVQSNKRPADKAIDAVARAAGLSSAQIAQYHSKVEGYLRDTQIDDLDPDRLKDDLEMLFRDPKEGAKHLRERIQHFDRNTLTTMLAQRDDLDQEKAQRYVVKVMTQVDSLKKKANIGTLEKPNDVMDEKFISPAHPVGLALGEREPTHEEKSRLKGALQDYLARVHDPKVSYEGLKHDFELLLHEPKAGADALMARAKAMDKDTVRELLAARQDISEERADQIVAKYDEARTRVIAKAEEMQQRIETKVEQARVKVREQAEEAREIAATAAWWSFATAVVSGIAAAIGGIIAVAT